MKNTLSLPDRSNKPRDKGLTMLIDSGKGLSRIQETLEIGASYIDYVKLGWATSAITPNLSNKIKAYHDAGIPVCLGGTLFEVCYTQGKLEEYQAFAKEHKIDYVEISDGTIEMPRKDKLDAIEYFAKHFTVLSEYGSKTDGDVGAPSYWANRMQEELNAGAWKVIAEGRESGTAGMYRGNAELRTGLVDEILLHIAQENVMWEAPLKAQQTWFINKFGAEVNLGNIAFDDVIPLETLRLGIRSDTFEKFHGA